MFIEGGEQLYPSVESLTVKPVIQLEEEGKYDCILGSKKSVHFVFGDFPLPIMLNVHVFGTKIKSRTGTL